jgi:hypothetical protein
MAFLQSAELRSELHAYLTGTLRGGALGIRPQQEELALKARFNPGRRNTLWLRSGTRFQR